METVWIVLGIVFIVVGLAGCILPVLPGPPLSFAGLLILQLRDEPAFSVNFLILWGIIALIVTLLDYWIPVFGTKKFGGSQKGVWGAVVGLVAGLFLFPPVGIIIGPVIGALAGELISGKTSMEAARSAVGSFLGFLIGTTLKLAVSGMMAFYFFRNL